jgi:hypothetical protein
VKLKVSDWIAVFGLILLSWMGGYFLWGALSAVRLIGLAIGSLAFGAALVLATRRVNQWVWFGIGLLMLAGLFVPISVILDMAPLGGLESIEFGFVFVIFPATLIIADLLLSSALNRRKGGRDPDGAGIQSGSQPEQFKTASLPFFVLCGLLILKLMHSFYWFMVWDSTGDSLGGLWFIFMAPVILFSAILLVVMLLDRKKFAAGFYLLCSLGLVLAFAIAAQVDFRQLTEDRANRVSQAVARFHTQEGQYPSSLDQLTPRYLFSIPGPVIMYAQDWCYHGGDDYYRLGYVDRQHWSDPRLFGHIYKIQGESADLPRLCEAEVMTLQARYPESRYEYWVGGAP